MTPHGESAAGCRRSSPRRPSGWPSNLGELAGGATVWLAVTGLSRSGKTVFITSLIHNLLSSLHNPNRMPLLGVVGERRLIAARLEGAKAHRLPRFPYLDNIEKMAVPDWPAAHRRPQRDRHRGPLRARRTRSASC